MPRITWAKLQHICVFTCKENVFSAKAPYTIRHLHQILLRLTQGAPLHQLNGLQSTNQVSAAPWVLKNRSPPESGLQGTTSCVLYWRTSHFAALNQHFFGCNCSICSYINSLALMICSLARIGAMLRMRLQLLRLNGPLFPCLPSVANLERSLKITP